MKRIIAPCLAMVFFASTALPAHAFWIERHPKLKGAWLIHCKNREDYPLRGDRGDAVEMARQLCYELTGKEEHAMNDSIPLGGHSNGDGPSSASNNSTPSVSAVTASTNIYINAGAILSHKLY